MTSYPSPSTDSLADVIAADDGMSLMRHST